MCNTSYGTVLDSLLRMASKHLALVLALKFRVQIMIWSSLVLRGTKTANDDENLAPEL